VVAFIGLWEFLILIAVIALVFGTARFTAAGRALGRGAKEFKRGIRGGQKPPELPPGA
jgi:TatA/E family protein of Tat protein translocase